MTPEEIPRGSLCVLDTNILIYAEQGMSAQAARLLQRIASGDLEGTLPLPVWQELMHKFMLAEAMALRIIPAGNPARQLAEKPALVKKLSAYREKIVALSDMGVGFEPCTRHDLLQAAPALQGKYGLLTNDSLLLAVALRLKADAVVTADSALKPVTEIHIVSPGDIKTS